MELKQVLESGDLETIREKTRGAQRGGPAARAGALRRRPGRPRTGRRDRERRGSLGTEDEVVEDADFEVIDDDETATKA